MNDFVNIIDNISELSDIPVSTFYIDKNNQKTDTEHINQIVTFLDKLPFSSCCQSHAKDFSKQEGILGYKLATCPSCESSFSFNLLSDNNGIIFTVICGPLKKGTNSDPVHRLNNFNEICLKICKQFGCYNRQDLIEMQKNLDRLEMALSGGKVSVWDWDIPSEEVHRSYDWHKTQEHNEFYKPGDLGDWRGWVHPDDRELAFSVLNDFSQGKQSHYEVEYRMQRPGEKWRWVRERGKATEYSQEGLPIRAVGTLMDIHHRKTTEAELLESQRKFSALLVNLPGMAYRCTNDSRWTMEYVSKGAGDLFECDASELMDDSGFKHMGRIYYEDIEKVENTVEQSLLDRSHFQITYRIVTAKDNIKWVWEQAGFVCDSKGEVIALEGFIIDISREKEAESAELEKAKLAAAIETAGAACHELSQPLQVLMAKLELMMMSKPDDDPLLAELNQLSVYAQTMAEITHKLNRLTQYHTTDYIGDARILDLNRSAGYRF